MLFGTVGCGLSGFRRISPEVPLPLPAGQDAVHLLRGPERGLPELVSRRRAANRRRRAVGRDPGVDPLRPRGQRSRYDYLYGYGRARRIRMKVHAGTPSGKARDAPLSNPCRFSGIPHPPEPREVSLWALAADPDILDAKGQSSPRIDRKGKP